MPGSYVLMAAGPPKRFHISSQGGAVVFVGGCPGRSTRQTIRYKNCLTAESKNVVRNEIELRRLEVTNCSAKS